MNNKTLSLIQRLYNYDAAKHDEIEPAKVVKYEDGGFTFNGRRIRATETATKQMLASCGIPADFFTIRMNDGERASVFNRLNAKQGDVERMFRFSNDDKLYGVVSQRYKKLDNVRILDILNAASDSGIGLRPVRWTLNPDHTRVTLVPTGAEVGELTPCVNITNSENGLASLTVWAGVYRWVCANGMMVPLSEVTRSRWMHLGNADITLPDIGTILNESQQWTERLYESKRRYLSAEEKSDIVVKIADKLGQKAAEKVVHVANREYHGGRTMFDAVGAVTRAAHFFRPAQQSELEHYAYKMLKAA
jgi:hypothetical protein